MLLSFILFFIVVIAFYIIVEVFSVLFRLTGMSEEKARYQTISLLTTCGFTTKESELIIMTRSRRKIAETAMIFGYCFSATLVSAFVSLILNIDKSEISSLYLLIAVLAILLVIFIILSKIKFIRKAFDALIFKLAHKISKDKNKNQIKVVDNYGQNFIVEVTIAELPEEFAEKTLEGARIKQNYGLNVLAILRSNKTINNVTKEEQIKKGDIVTIYGNINTINELFSLSKE